jgi:peroxidase
MNGLLNDPAGKYDTNMNDHLQNHLFEFPLSDGTIQAVDLFAANVQRGRDHGLPSYIDIREKCGSGRIQRFAELRDTMPPETVDKLEVMYETVRDIDFFVGGLAERPIAGGAAVGPTFACIIARQFSDLKRGDRFFYENSPRVWTGALSMPQLNEIKRMTLSHLLCSNFDMKHVQVNALLLSDQVK